MDKLIKFEIVTPERIVLKESVLQASIPTTTGEITILPGHLPLISIVKAGVLELKKADGQAEVMAVSGGLLEVLTDKIVILADTAETAAELDETRIMEARAKAEILKQEKVGDVKAFAQATALLDKEMARHHAVRRWKKIKNIESIN